MPRDQLRTKTHDFSSDWINLKAWIKQMGWGDWVRTPKTQRLLVWVLILIALLG
jgi:hypothetical protein